MLRAKLLRQKIPTHHNFDNKSQSRITVTDHHIAVRNAQLALLPGGVMCAITFRQLRRELNEISCDIKRR